MTSDHSDSRWRPPSSTSEHPDKSPYTDSSAVAVVDGLKTRVEGPRGASLVSDMPKAVGGEGSATWMTRCRLVL